MGERTKLEMALREQVLSLEVVTEGFVAGSGDCGVRRSGIQDGHQETAVFMGLKKCSQ